MMFQSYALFPHLSIRDNVAFSLKMKGVGKEERHAKADEMLKLVDMETRAERFPNQLGRPAAAGGAGPGDDHQPADFLLDEPLSALDPLLRIRMGGPSSSASRRSSASASST